MVENTQVDDTYLVFTVNLGCYLFTITFKKQLYCYVAFTI